METTKHLRPTTNCVLHRGGTHRCADDALISDQESLVIRLRFGLGGLGERTLQQVADALSMSKQRVHQIEKSALKKLSKSEKLRSYWGGYVGD